MQNADAKWYEPIMVPIHRDGWPFIAIFGASAGILSLIWSPLGWLGLAATLWCAYFFRNPPRMVPQNPGLILAPGDGVVVAVGPAPAPVELGLAEGEHLKISIFLNVFDCHMNRAPLAGKVMAKVYTPGKFVNANLDKASTDNERMALRIKTDDGFEVGVVQIAGLVARRIVCAVKEGDQLATGAYFGHIRFGSRVDLYLPAGTVPNVAVGQRAIGGETVLADRLNPKAALIAQQVS